MILTKILPATLLIIHLCLPCAAQREGRITQCKVDFSQTLRQWDGFGLNYVETAQTHHYETYPQDYGGFSLLNEEQKKEIINLFFGPDGLRPGVIKMFLDPFHLDANGAYNHQKTTKNMEEFVQRGIAAGSNKLQIISTLYGPPAAFTLNGEFRTRDIDPNKQEALADYYIHYIKYLRQNNIDCRYISLHNEGEDWIYRYPSFANNFTKEPAHDYNAWWSPEFTVAFIDVLRSKMDKAGLKNVGIAPGEPTFWYRFAAWGYADAIAENKQAIKNIGLIASHGFSEGAFDQSFGIHTSLGNDIIREKRPEIHSWVTSMSWGKMDAKFIKNIHGHIYHAKVNALIPWAAIQRPAQWAGNDPNPGTAVIVREDSTYEVLKGYYFYKQVSTAGQPGSTVVKTSAMNSEIALIAFAEKSQNNFVVINIAPTALELEIDIKGSNTDIRQAYRTDSESENCMPLTPPAYTMQGSKMMYTAPAGSVTTFFINK